MKILLCALLINGAAQQNVLKFRASRDLSKIDLSVLMFHEDCHSVSHADFPWIITSDDASSWDNPNLLHDDD